MRYCITLFVLGVAGIGVWLGAAGHCQRAVEPAPAVLAPQGESRPWALDLRLPSVVPDTQLTMALRMLPEGRELHVGEPLIVEVTIETASEDPFHVSIGNDTVPRLYLAVLDADGTLLSDEPPRAESMGGVSGAPKVAAEAPLVELRVLKDPRVLSRPGDYEARVYLLDAYVDVHESSVFAIAEAALPLRVLERDAVALDETLHELFRVLHQADERDRAGIWDIPTRAAMDALTSVRDDAAVPYLQRLVVQYQSQEACRALRRVGTDRSKAAFDDLAARKDAVGEVARRALAMPLEDPPPGAIMD